MHYLSPRTADDGGPAYAGGYVTPVEYRRQQPREVP